MKITSKTIRNITLFAFLFFIVKCDIFVHAGLYDDAYDYIQEFKETVQYNNSNFYFGQYGTTAQVGSARYSIIGFTTKVTVNGKPYSFISKVGGTFRQIGGDKTVAPYTYTLWAIDYNKAISRLKLKYPNDDFSQLSDKTATSTWTFDAIMSYKPAGTNTIHGSMNDEGGDIKGDVYFSADSFINNNASIVWSEAVRAEVAKLYGIEKDVLGNSKPKPILPTFSSFMIYDYDHLEGSTYWVKPTTLVKFTASTYINNTYGVYPEYMYMRYYKGEYNDANHFTHKQKRGTNGGTTSTTGTINGITADLTKSANSSSASASCNYLTGSFYAKFSEDNATYGVKHTSSFNGLNPGYFETGKEIRTDGTAPTIHGNTENVGWVYDSINLSILASDSGSGLESTKIYKNGVAILGLTHLNKSPGISNFKVESIDKVGNVNSVEFTHKIDMVSPKTTINTTPTTWSSSNILATIDATDSESGISKKQYTLSGATNLGWTDYSSALSISANGKTTITAKSVDNVNNTSSNVSSEVWIDKEKPTASISTTSKTWVNTDVSVTINASDGFSGVARREYKLNNDANWTPYIGAFLIKDNGKTSITVRSKDNAGNLSDEITTEVWIDKDNPTVSIGTISKKWSDANTGVSISGTDETSGIARTEYKLNNDINWTVYTGAFAITTNGKNTIIARSIDNAGNVSNEVTTEVWIDKEKPTVSIKTIPMSWQNIPIAVTIDGSDGSLSGLSKIQYNLKGATELNWTDYTIPFSISANGKTIISAKSTDNVGNVSAEAYSEVWYDDINPIGTFTSNKKTISRDIEINVESLVDIHSGVDEVWVSNNDSFTEFSKYSILGKTSETLKFTLDKKATIEENFSERTVHILLFDIAGNYTSYQIKIEVEPAPPAAPIILSPSDSNPLYVRGELVTIQWTHQNGANDFNLPQTKAIVTVYNNDTKKEKIFKVDGTDDKVVLLSLEDGQYTVNVETYNFGPYKSKSGVSAFRYHKFQNDGLVRTIKIEPQSNIKYLSIETILDIPEGTNVEGKIYYKANALGKMDYSSYVSFNVDLENKNEMIRLPSLSSNIQVDLALKNISSPKDPYISPVLDNIKVFAK